MWLTQYPQPRPPRETWESDPIFTAMQQAFTRAPRRERRSSWASTTWMPPPSRSAGGCCARPASPTPTSRWPTCRATPSGSRSQDWTDAYARHKQNLQLIGLNDPEKRWVLKNPSHMTALDALMTVYPDALIVYTHRDPVDLHRLVLLAVGRDHGRPLRDLRRRRDRPHPARPVVAGVPRVPRRPAGVRPGTVRRRRLQGPARRPDRHHPRALREVRPRLDTRRPRPRSRRSTGSPSRARPSPPTVRPQGLRPHRGPGPRRLRPT